MTEPRRSNRWKQHSLAHLQGDPDCAYCGLRPATSVDHILPLSKGGMMWDCANHAPACRTCNSKKKDKTWSTQPGSARQTIDIPTKKKQPEWTKFL